MLHTISPFPPKRRVETSIALDQLQVALKLQQPNLVVEKLRLLKDYSDITALPWLHSYEYAKLSEVQSIDVKVMPEWARTVVSLLQRVPLHGYFWFHTQRHSFFRSITIVQEMYTFIPFDNDGHFRERAVKRIDDTDPRAIAAQIVRLVDWVEPVRRFVEFNLSALLEIDAIPDQTLIECLPLLVELDRYQIVSEKIKQQFHCYIQNKPALLEAGIMHEEWRIARAATIIATASPATLNHNFIQIGLQSADPLVRLHWAEVGLADEAMRQNVYQSLKNERVPAIRIELLKAMDRDNDENVLILLKNGLFDSAARIRRFCQFALRQRGIQVKDVYRTVLDEPISSRTASSLIGLAECGDQSDANFALFYLDNEFMPIHYAAVRLLAQYATDEHQTMLWDLLNEQTPKIVRVAAQALQPKGLMLYPDWVSRYEKASPAIKRLLLHMARRMSWEQRKQVFLLALNDPATTEEHRTIIYSDYRFKMYSF